MERLSRQVDTSVEFRGISPGWRYKCRSYLHAVGPSKSLSLSQLETRSLIMPGRLLSGKA